MMHLPLVALRDHFSGAFDSVVKVDSYAVVSDPADRFRSALSEHVKTYHGKRLNELSADELVPVVDDIFAHVSRGPDLLPRRYSHFTPQVSYLGIDHTLVEGFALERLSELFALLSGRTGGSFSVAARANQDFAFRRRVLESAAWRANAATKALLPYGAYQKAKRRVKPLVAREVPRWPVEDALARTQARDFVNDFYARDFACHRSAPSRADGG